MTERAEHHIRYQIVSPLFREEYVPTYATSGAAGLDLHACIETAIPFRPGERLRIPTGIAIELPRRDMVALVYGRSGYAAKYGVALTNGVGVVDSDYTAVIQVLLSHFGNEEIVIQPGDRIAQMVIAPIYLAHFVESDVLARTERGRGGFGSTGERATKID